MKFNPRFLSGFFCSMTISLLASGAPWWIVLTNLIATILWTFEPKEET